MKFYWSPLRTAMADKRLLTILFLSALFAIAYNKAIVLGYAPDEPRHMAYVKLLWEEHRLPVIESAEPYREYKGAHAFHPPLYYLILMPAYLASKGFGDEVSWHVVRLVSALLCLATLPMIYVLGNKAGGGDKRVGLLAAGLTGLLPIFGMTAGSINNDAAALFFTVLFLYVLIGLSTVEKSTKHAVILGVILALGGWSKATVLLCGGIALLVAPFFFRKSSVEAFKAQWRVSGIALLVGALLVSPWHIRSFILYHQWNPMPTPAPWFHGPMTPLLVMAHPLFPFLLWKCNWGIFYTLWTQRDWVRQYPSQSLIQPPPLQPFQAGVFTFFAVLCLLALAGYILRRKETTVSGVTLWLPLAAFLGAWIAVLQIALFMHQGWAEGGRYLLPAFCGFATWLAIGWRKLLPSQFKWTAIAAVSWMFVFNVMCLHWLVTFCNPYYIPGYKF